MDDNLINELKDEVREALFIVVENILETSQVIVRVEAGSKKGDNFMGIVYRINCSTEDGSREFSLFVKVAGSDEAQRKWLSTSDCFLREIYAYEVVLPYFREFQESRDVYTDGFIEYSKIYKSISTEPTECLIMQDMMADNFIMINKNNLTPEHILLVMKTLGKLHAVSFAIRDQEPDKFAEITSELNEVLVQITPENTFSLYVNQMEVVTINCITDDEDAHLLKAVLELYETNQFDQIIDILNGRNSEPYSVVLHGDMWSNNTMYRYDETENTLQNVCLIDWQVVRYGSPVLDLLYYIFISTTRKLRGQNYNLYLRTYHESLSNLLERLGSDPEKLFPFSALQDQLQKLGKFGVMYSSFVLPVVTQEIDLVNLSVDNLSEEFKKRFRDIVADSYRLGYV